METTDLKKIIEIAHAISVSVFGKSGQSASTLFIGSRGERYSETMRVLEDGVDFLVTRCGIGPRSPLENVLQLRNAMDDYATRQ